MAELAVIKTGGKQYLVFPGKTIKIDPPASFSKTKQAGKTESKEIIFQEVLLVEKGKVLEIGAPLIKKAKVIGKVKKEGKAKKVIIFKHKAKKRYNVKKGHRQPYIEVEITEISN